MKFTLAFLILASTAILVASMRSSGASKKRPAKELIMGPDGELELVRPPINKRRSGAILGPILAKWESAKWECAELERNAKQRAADLTQGEREAIFDKWKCNQDEFEAIVAEWDHLRLKNAGTVSLVNERNLLCILFHDNQDQFKRILARAKICNANDDPKTIREIILELEQFYLNDAIIGAVERGLTIKSFD